MATERRVQRLREMVGRIERLPASTDRDRLLSEVRSRAVDVDTDVTPRAMLPMREPELIPETAGLSNPERATSVTRRAPQPPTSRPKLTAPAAPAAPPSRFPTGRQEPSPWASERLSLEDPLQLAPLPHVLGRGGRAVPPWTLGLRA